MLLALQANSGQFADTATCATCANQLDHLLSKNTARADNDIAPKTGPHTGADTAPTLGPRHATARPARRQSKR